jgi:hypothetical protein
MADIPITGTDLVAAVICSLDGGYNGLNPNLRLGITPNDDGTIAYELTDESTDSPTVQAFTVTIVPTEG